jgi:Na+-driven multidrug efflux pump
MFLIPLVLSSIVPSAGGTLNSIVLGRLIGVGALAAVSSQGIWYAYPIAFICSLAGNLAYDKFFLLRSKVSAR